jgi:type IV pilus assembly protein PilM
VAPTDSRLTLVVDLGARATDMAIVSQEQVVFTHSIGTAGEALTRAVASELKLEPAQAEEYKKAYGVDPKQLEGKVRGAIDPILEVVVKEMSKMLEFYRSKHPDNLVTRAVLTGGTAGLPEVVSLMAQKLGIEVQLADPFSRLEKEGEILAKLPEGTAPLYAIAVGLALKEIS